jgi:hypothetical protein
MPDGVSRALKTGRRQVAHINRFGLGIVCMSGRISGMEWVDARFVVKFTLLFYIYYPGFFASMAYRQQMPSSPLSTA